MSESIVLLVGGTKVLERELQSAVAAPLVSVATMEDGAKVLGDRPVRLMVLGPTLRRALAVVTTFRADGRRDPQLLVVYRDDQRDEVKRHQKGKLVADGYIAQSRIQKELGETAATLWAINATSELDLIAQPAVPQITNDHEPTQMLDLVVELEAYDEPPPTPEELAGSDQPGSHDVLGAFDADALDGGDGPEELLASDLVEDFDGEIAAAPDGGDPSLVLMTMENSILEVLPDDDDEVELLDGDAELLSDDDEVLVADGDALHDDLGMVEEIVGADMLEEMGDVSEMLEEVDSAELMEDLEELPPDAVAGAPSLGSTRQRSAQIMAAVVPQVQAAPAPEAVAPAVVEARAPPPVDTATDGPTQRARMVVDARPPVADAPAPVAAALVPSERAKTSGAHAMFTELTTFVEKLQDAASSIARLESENDHLRHDLTKAEALARPTADADLAALRSEADELRLRLMASEQSREAAVDARIRAEQAFAVRDEEATRLHSELAAAGAASAGLHTQLEVKRRIAADSAKSLAAIAAMLDA